MARLSSSTRLWVPVIALTAVGFFLRIWHINFQSAWSPEVLSTYAASLSSRDMISWLIVDHKHYLDAPLYYFLLRCWFALFGSGVLQARLLALCFGVLSIPAAYLFARLVTEKRTALVATFIFTISQAAVVQSQEARPYSQLGFFFVVTSYLFLRALRERRAWLWWSATFLSALLLLTDFYGLFALAVLVGFAVATGAGRMIPWTRWAGAGLVPTLLVGTWIAATVAWLPISSELLFRADGSFLDKNLGWLYLPAALVRLNGAKWFGIESPTPAWLALLGVLLFTVPALVGAVRMYQSGSGQRSASVLLTALCIVPLAASVALGSLGYNKYLDFENHLQYAFFAAVPYYILVATGLEAVPLRGARTGALASLLVFSAVGLRAVYSVPYKPDYRAGVTAMANAYRDGDCSLFYPVTVEDPLLGHRKGAPPFWRVYSPGRTDARLVALKDVVSGDSGCARVWFFWDHAPWMDRWGESAAAKQALDHTLAQIGQQKYYLTEIDLYQGKPDAAGAARQIAGAH